MCEMRLSKVKLVSKSRPMFLTNEKCFNRAALDSIVD